MTKENNVLSIIYILLGMTVFSVQDTLVRLVSEDVSILQVLFFRSTIAIILITLFLRFTNQKIEIKTAYPILTTLRTIIFIFAFLFYYIGLANLSFAIATALFFTAPFFITILSSIFLKEKVGLIRWSIIIFGFFGVLLIVDPSLDEVNYYMIYPILCALGYAISMIIIKLTSDSDNVYTQAIHVYLMTIFLCPIMTLIGFQIGLQNDSNDVIQFMFRYWSFDSHVSQIMLLIIGICVVFGFIFIFNAYRLGKPYVVAPFEYVLLLWSVSIGWLVWDETISLQSWIGMGIIVVAGIFIFYREKVNDQEITVDQPLR